LEKRRSGIELHPLNNIDPLVHAPARLMVLSYLYVLDSADYVFLMQMTGLTWGNLATHLKKLEESGYIAVEKEFHGKKPHSTLRLSAEGRRAFRDYIELMKGVFNDLPS
jgi:DNA-binding MarR family transcriptional regulator